ncbi:MAG: xanthine dehydrogenase family protein molybdopterin-binding subunit [Fusobacterium sp.]|nr:xanthine dehydrogenase family protein molybdopterin-binding subunit [Fusobacterium sp.]
MKKIGKTYPIHDARAKVTGKAKYVGDLELQNMLHAAVIVSSIPHGKIISMDTSEALKMEGVVDVLTPFNTTENKYSRYKTRDEQDWVELTERVFADHVRFIGDPIGAVVAETEDLAREAVKKVKVEYEEYPAAITLEEGLAGKNNCITEKGNIAAELNKVYGDKDVNTDDCVKITTAVKINRVHHASMETHGCAVDINFNNDNIVVYSPNQAVFGVRMLIANLFEIPDHKVRVVKTTMGGSFGAKQEWYVEPLAVACALKVRRPVRMIYNREECMASTVVRAEMKNTMTTYYQKDGKFRKAEVDVIINKGAYEGNAIPYVATMLTKWGKAYRFDNLVYRGRAVMTNTPVSGAFRGWSASEAVCTIEHNINEAAKALNIDPVDIRIKNCMLRGEADVQTGITMGEIRGKECLELGREKFEWDRRKKEIAEFNRTNERYKRGIGVGFGGHVSGFYPKVIDFARVDMKMTDKGKVVINATVHDHGCGTVTMFKMIAAEVLDIPVDDIQMSEADSEKTPYDIGCYSSRTTYVVGRTAQNCAEDLLKLLLDHAAKQTESKVEDLFVEEGHVYSKTNPNLKMTYREVVYNMMFKEQVEAFVSTTYKNESSPGTVGAQFAEVEVDTFSGMTRVRKFIAVHDIGKALNREMCVAQIQGAMVMGAGMALSENFKIREDGKPLNSLKDYHVVNSYEAPEMEVYFVEDQGTDGPFGGKSIGEACVVPSAAAVCGAVNNALGSSIGEYPLNPDRIIKYLRDKK